MSSTAAGWLQFGLLFVILAACYVPLGNYMARIFTSPGHRRSSRSPWPGRWPGRPRYRRAPAPSTRERRCSSACSSA